MRVLSKLFAAAVSVAALALPVQANAMNFSVLPSCSACEALFTAFGGDTVSEPAPAPVPVIGFPSIVGGLPSGWPEAPTTGSSAFMPALPCDTCSGVMESFMPTSFMPSFPESCPFCGNFDPSDYCPLCNGGGLPPVPEAETYALMLAGLGTVAYAVRRRRRV